MTRAQAVQALQTMAADTARLLPLNVDFSAIGIVVQQTSPDSLPGPVIEDPAGRVEPEPDEA